MNILFILYYNFASPSGGHVHYFANHLTAMGLDCVVAIPGDKFTVSRFGKNLYKVIEFPELATLKHLFKNHQGPDIVHAWTPREANRMFYEKLKRKYPNFKLVIHLEDNEELILESYFNKPFKEILHESHKLAVPNDFSHPQKYRQFLQEAIGVTVIIDQLREFVPPNIPVLTLYPGADTKRFYPQPPNPKLKQKLGLNSETIVFCYNGNVHSANESEVKSIYLAVALMNRRGQSAVLLRAGRDSDTFLSGADRLFRQYSIELGYVDYTKMPQILALADVLIQPGKANKFNDYRLPSKLPEYLSMGKPVILPHTNIGRMLRHSKEAIVLPVVDATNIVDYVNLVMSDRAWYDQLGQGAVDFAKANLSWQKNSEALLSFYNKI